MRKIAIAMTTMMIISVVQKSLSLPFPEAAPVLKWNTKIHKRGVILISYEVHVSNRNVVERVVTTVDETFTLPTPEWTANK